MTPARPGFELQKCTSIDVITINYNGEVDECYEKSNDVSDAAIYTISCVINSAK